ncbi:pentatricopeptide repeat-containing protein At1g11290, chloroplastic isoform X2 [Selaginella moellendorffii]|uniref:pentatricopeptide repeat-containing protein At1g11290, chloroplastic isoform X2 n=1 Tax=Selaginella moellendorffii TaxID=88036 RepID=UPI000D1C847B|nr:pentatricopeptide repeat-containing protein At1g11290, chloroplastic isoform X2 [Selaginella moellendorffii]|eukprot:XP_024538251.1 pentatricopeptide repeat-containing protein At1g11290, chloroplastic isoform X2 [Selaginella moellendorffii]
MYGRLGSTRDARTAFDAIYRRNVFSWNLLIGAYCSNCRHGEALDLFQAMIREAAVDPNHITYIGVVSACSWLGDLARGREIHARIVADGLGDSHVFLENSLITMYGRCGSLEEARGIFQRMAKKDTGSWNALMAACVENGREAEAVELYREMDVAADGITFTTVLGACSRSIADGRDIHRDIWATTFRSDASVTTALVTMYGRNGSLAEAREVFERIRDKNVVAWTSMIVACVHNGAYVEALTLKRRMDLEGVKANSVTFASALDACSGAGSLADGRLLESSLSAQGLERDLVLGTALIDMYGKCGKPDDAAAVFANLKFKSLIAWNAMIGAWSHNVRGREAMHLFCRMDQEGIQKDRITYLNILEALGHGSFLREAKVIHARIVASGLDSEVAIGNAIVNMYGKAGSLAAAKLAFDGLKLRDVVSWTSIIAAYSRQGRHREVPALSCEMHLEGVKANGITFVHILHAFSHSGLVREGCLCFASMMVDHGLHATRELCGCMVDLLGKAGWILEAQDMINAMPFQPDAVSWTSLLNACVIHSEVPDRARHAAAGAYKLEDKDFGAPYVALSNLYFTQSSSQGSS